MGAALKMFPFTSHEVREHFISAEQLMRVCDQVWSADRKADIPLQRQQPQTASSIYCKVDHLVGLFDTVRKVRNRVVLVSSESDRPITTEFLGRCPPQIGHWFSTNIDVEDGRLEALPLGLSNSYCDITLRASLIAEESREFTDRSNWLYVNFRTSSHPAVRGPIMDYFRSIRSVDWITLQEGHLSLEDYLAELTSHRFVLCPPGNGTDTHRLWEALYSRTIPVALDRPAMAAFRDLPILFVENFRNLNRDFLAGEYERMRTSQWNWPKLFLPWWRDRIAEECGKLKSAGSGTIPRSRFLREIAGAQLAELKRRVLRRA
jgi:hypothetical protein